MKSGKFFSFVVVMAALAMSLSAWGQATTSLRGVITDPSGAAIPHAKVTITNQDTNVSRQTISTTTGAYSFASVLPGAYKLTVEAQGFRTYAQAGVQLLVSLPSTLNVRLQVGAVTQVVNVTGQAPALNTTNASIGQVMGTSAIENLPIKAENTVLLLSFQPGVVFNGEKLLTDSTDTRAGSVNGERSDQNNITLDGVSDNDEFSGYAFNGVLPTTPFSVQEFRVTTSNYGATEGHTAGAQISMVTKSGTNQFHGSLYEFNRNTVGEANDYFLKSSQAATGQPNVPEHLVRNIFGGTIGGPFMKNRFFFFFNYEGHRQSLAGSATRAIPSATLRDGIIEYKCSASSSCPGSNVTGVSGKSYAVQPGYYALSPTQLAQLDPLGIGPSSVALKYFNSYPMPTSLNTNYAPNFGAYTFAAPTKESYNWYIGRLDYKLTQNGNHTLFFRGTGVDDRSVGAPFLPGSVPENSNVDLSKGFVLGYTGVFGPHWVNSFRYGLTRASYGNIGNSNQPWIIMRGLDQGITRSSTWVSPVHNLVDTVSYIHGAHNFQFGANFLLVRSLGTTDANSYSDAMTNSDWVNTSGFANKSGSPLNPPSGGFPAVDSHFNLAYDFPLAAMMGMATELDARYNYRVASLTQGTPLGQGASVARHWATDTYNLFFEDTWQARRNLSVTYGLNYQLMTPVTETAGQQVAPNVNMGTWFNQRSINMMQGIPSNQDALISFAPSGSAWGKPGMYSSQTRDFAPRLGLAWTPRPKWGWLKKIVGDNKTAVRAGFGMYYDNFGPELAMTYNAVGEFGLATLLENPAASLTVAQAPRITSMNTLPTTDTSGNTIMPQAPSSAFPVTYPVGAEAIARGIDPSLKSPYSYALDLSIQRQLPGGMTLDMAYVGHFAHRLLVYDDIATPLDLKDPKSGIDYFSAVDRLSQLARQNTPDSAITASAIGPTAQYWEDMVKPLSNYRYCSSWTMTPGGSQTDMLQAVYDMFGANCSLYNETTGLWLMDLPKYVHYSLPQFATGPNSFYNSQYSSLYVWRSIGYSNYNALQVSLHKQMAHGLLFGFNYTYSKSNDIESMAERGPRHNSAVIINPWSPYQLYGPSDFDLRHQINYYWVAQLPFGRGKLVGANVANWANAIIGGWQLSGTGRWTSGFPASVFMGYVWPTNWEEMGQANLTGQPIATGTTIVNTPNVGSAPNVFQNPTQASAGFGYAYPGQSGARNVIRGDGYFGLDMSLAKTWALPRLENQSVQVRWNVYNALNTNRFDIQGANLEWDTLTFGNYNSTLTNPRVMEFSMVYAF
jgi:Carboxypeptidase regulatory-like domain